jgi:hypothetical protein
MSSSDIQKNTQARTNEKAMALSPSLAKAFEGIEKHKPRALAEKHPHILEKLNSLWPAPECIAYLDELMLPKRGGRAGFEPAVMSEILLLKQLHLLIYPAGFSNINGDFDRTYQTVFHPSSIEDIIGADSPEHKKVTEELRKMHASAVQSILEHACWGEMETIEQLKDFWDRKKVPGSAKTKKLGEIFVDFDLLSDDAVEAALDHQHGSSPRPRFGHILVDAKLCSPRDVSKALAHQAKLALINLDKMPITADSLECLPLEVAKRIRAIPVAKIDNILFVAVENPLFFPYKDELKFSSKLTIELVCANGSAISRRLSKYSPGAHTPSHAV